MNEYTESEITVIKNSYNEKTAREISLLLNRALSSVQSKILELGIKKERTTNAIWSDEDIQYLKDNYQEKTYNEMSAFLNRTEKSVKMKAHKLGLKKNGNYYDVNKFDKIVTEEDAYWLGFLYADGYVVVSNNSYFGVELQKKDENHLRKLNKFMNGNSTIYHRTRKSPTSENLCETSSVLFSGEKLAFSLISHGCVQRKSKIIQFPNLEEHLNIPFIRGYFDGDGSFGKYGKYNYIRASMTCGSYSFLNSIKNIIEKYNIKSGVCEDRGCYKLNIGGEKNCSEFLNLIYKDAKVYLDRKYNNYINMLCPNL